MGLDFTEALKGWTPRFKTEEERTQHEKEKVTNENDKYIASLILGNKDQFEMLNKINESCGEERERLINQFIQKSESYFLKVKKLPFFMERNSITDSSDPIEVYGSWSDERYHLERLKDGYRIILPPLTGKRVKDARGKEGMAIYYLASHLLKKEKEKNGLAVFEKASITFTHFIDENEILKGPMDADNVDIKKVIDAIKGRIILDDNLLRLEIHQKAESADWGHTEIVIEPIE